MASVTEKPQPESRPQRIQPAEEHLVDQQIGRTRRALKLVDFSAGCITLAIGVLAFLLTMAVLEHWVVPGGWSETARFLLFGGLLLGIVWYSWRTFWPLLWQPINPAFAAQAIEQSSPSLKNSLLNLLLLRNHKRRMSQQVYQAIEQQAAQRLSQVRLESVVDRSIILRLGYILLALTAICALYRFFSPKDLFSSAGRVLAPWSDIATPSRVQILDIAPGNTKAARGEQLEISAEVLGLEIDEPVRLLYSTIDEQIVGQEVHMTAAAGGSLFSCLVPARVGVGRGGIQQDFSYWIEAGDARSPRFEVEVYARPTMVVNRLRYDYPAYTGFPSREVEHTGDIRAVEGTNVTLFAQANKSIKTAHVDFEADGRRDLLMNADDQQATVTFPLALRDDRRTPRYQSYVLRYVTADGNQNEQPPKYQIDVQPDYSPEIELRLPEEAVLDVALNQEVEFELDAIDPDFALSKVMLLGKVGEQQLLQEELLARNHTGRFVGKLRKTPEQMGLKVGDVLEYWGAAADNRRPEANLAYSAHRKLRVIDPWQANQGGEKNQDGEGERQQGEGGKPQEGEGGQEGQAGGGEQSEGSEGEQGAEGEGGQGQESGEPSENNEQQQGEGGGGEGSDDQQNGGGDAQGESSGENDRENNDESPPEGEGGEPSEDAAGGEGGEQGKVSSEGDDDGSAFERMAEHFKDQLGESGDGAEGDDQSNSAQNTADGQTDGDRQGESGDRETKPGEQNAGQEGADKDQQSDGEGAQGEPAPSEEENQGDADDQQQQEGESPAGEMSPEQGNAGAGDNPSESQGAPSPDGEKSPEEKQGEPTEAADQENSEAPSEGRDNSESDSEGGQGGDRSGGGQEGGGQQADRDGKGGAGEHEAADDGAGQSSETGEGETGDQPGNQSKAEGETGESSGDQPGQGSEQGEQQGEQPGGETPSEAQNGEQPNQQPNQSEPPPGESASAEGQASAGQPAGTGGKPSAPPPGGELQPGDEANLDFARKQTDLILDRLEHQLKKKEVDKSLLEKLGWTQDELQRFVDRWKNLKSRADEDSASSEADSELNDALRSLGLGRNRRSGFKSKIAKDKLRDLQDAFRGRVPLEYQEQVNRYIKGTATAQENE